tara:strand:+ start:208 stop:453 length:246 start_codon:yes stop_codon:yes gene_type:complete
MILEISITAKNEDTKAISYALQFIENGNTKRLPKSLAVQPDLTSTYKTKKYPNIKRILPINRHLFMAVIQMLSQVQVQCSK